MDAKKVTYLPNVYEMINSSAYQIATGTTDAEKQAASVSATGAFGSRVIGSSTRTCRENTFWRVVAGVAALAIAIKYRKGIGTALKKIAKPIGEGLKNAFSWVSRIKVSIKPKNVAKNKNSVLNNPPKIRELLKQRKQRLSKNFNKNKS